MPEEYFDVAIINFDEAILHGRVTAGRDEYGCRLERDVRITLDEHQKGAIEEMQARHHDELQSLLSAMAHAEAA